MMNAYPLISAISSPEDLKALPERQLAPLMEELRRFLIDRVTLCGGHLASNLGVVELTVALHRVFSTPVDRIVWDVGHQCYVHKILTGRADRFDSLRTPGGLSGFPSPAESEHDAFYAGHASTSLSVALGYAEADRLAGRENYTVAVVGDGSFTGGMIHEALNNCRRDLNLIVVLNDNEMSISRNTGHLSRYFSRLRTSRSYIKTKSRTRKFLSCLPLIGKPVYRLLRWVRNRFRGLVYRNNYFENFGMRYYGPVDGNNEAVVERVLSEARRRRGASVIHLRTKKGCGYTPAEQDPTAYHGISPCGAPTGEGKSFSQTAGECLSRMAEKDTAIVAVTAAMSEGTGLSGFAARYPDRFFDVGIAEEHALTFAAGLAAAGMKPYFAVYSTFLQRAYDNLIHDTALGGFPVRILVDRAGLAFGDGATHHGVFDVAFASTLPNITVWSATTPERLSAMLALADTVSGPLLIRYPAGRGSDEVRDAFFSAVAAGDAPALRACGEGTADAVVITYGRVAREALKARALLSEEGIDLHIYLLEQLKPYDKTAEAILSRLPDTCPVIFLEEGVADGGAAMHTHGALLAAAPDFGARHPYTVLAIDNCFDRPLAPTELYAHHGIDAEAVARAVRKARE